MPTPGTSPDEFALSDLAGTTLERYEELKNRSREAANESIQDLALAKFGIGTDAAKDRAEALANASAVFSPLEEKLNAGEQLTDEKQEAYNLASQVFIDLS